MKNIHFKKLNLREAPSKNRFISILIMRFFHLLMSKASDKFIGEAVEEMPTGRSSVEEVLQIVSHVTDKSLKKDRCGKKSRKY